MRRQGKTKAALGFMRQISECIPKHFKKPRMWMDGVEIFGFSEDGSPIYDPPPGVEPEVLRVAICGELEKTDP